MRSAFEQFLKSEYSSENLNFWCCCERYKKLKTDEQRCKEAENIFEQFISPRSPNQVRIEPRSIALLRLCNLVSESCMWLRWYAEVILAVTKIVQLLLSFVVVAS